jgi:uncharacterized membrane protein
VILIIVVAVVILSNSGGSSRQTVNTEITRSTVARVPLPKGSVNETGYYTDTLGWIENETKLLAGLKNFYQKTGVQPHVYITDTVNDSNSPSVEELDNFAHALYDKLFTDEAHLLLVFFEYDGEYITRYVCGTQAKTVIDTEAADILLDYLDRYYFDDRLTDEEFFSKAFSDAAIRIMTVTRSPWITVLVVFLVLVVILVLFAWWSRIRRQKYLELKQAEEMLKIPLEKFKDREVEDLERKYEDDNENK